MGRKLTIAEVKERIKEVHGDTVILDESTYVNVSTKCIFVDKDYGGWEAAPQGILYQKTGHPERGSKMSIKSRTLSIEEVNKRIFGAHGNIVSLDESTYKGTHKKARFIDVIHGEWWAIPNCIFIGQGHPNKRMEKIKGPEGMKLGSAYAAEYGCVQPNERNCGSCKKVHECKIKNYMAKKMC